jgi:hypothetical protein
MTNLLIARRKFGYAWFTTQEGQMMNLNGSDGSLTDVLYTVKEVKCILKLQSDKSVYRLIQRGYLKCCSAIRHKLISRESLEAFIKSTTR